LKSLEVSEEKVCSVDLVTHPASLISHSFRASPSYRIMGFT
jgi:hypothetical protein